MCSNVLFHDASVNNIAYRDPGRCLIKMLHCPTSLSPPPPTPLSRSHPTPSHPSRLPSSREKLLDFLWSVKQPDGSFVMHVGGEVDVR